MPTGVGRRRSCRAPVGVPTGPCAGVSVAPGRAPQAGPAPRGGAPHDHIGRSCPRARTDRASDDQDLRGIADSSQTCSPGARPEPAALPIGRLWSPRAPQPSRPPDRDAVLVISGTPTTPAAPARVVGVCRYRQEEIAGFRCPSAPARGGSERRTSAHPTRSRRSARAVASARSRRAWIRRSKLRKVRSDPR